MIVVLLLINVTVGYLMFQQYRAESEAERIRTALHADRSDKAREIRPISSKQYYKMFKFMHLQATGGARMDQIVKTMYKVIEDRSLRNEMMTLAAYISETGSLEFFKRKMKERKMNALFLTTVFSMIDNGLDREVLKELDYLYFNQYLNDIREATMKIKRGYLLAVVLMVFAVSTAVLLPMFSEMMSSIREVFR